MSTQDEQMNLVRQSLLNSLFAPYHQLMGVLKSLPLEPMIPLFQKACLDIDTGITLIKELINSNPLKLNEPAPIPPLLEDISDIKEEEDVAA